MEITIIQKRIFEIRGQWVMLDRHLAELYGVPTKSLNLAVKRNIKRFPTDFMFRLTREEYDSLRFQIETLKRGAHSKYLPYVFTEHGVSMLSSVLNSDTAIQVNINIIRAFMLLKQYQGNFKLLQRKIDEVELKLNRKIETINELIEYLLSKPEQKEPRRRIGFKP